MMVNLLFIDEKFFIENCYQLMEDLILGVMR